MKLFCFLFGVFTTACAPHAKQFSVDPAFAPYVTLFYAEAAKRGISPQHEDLIVRYDERESLRDSNLMGECNTNYVRSIMAPAAGILSVDFYVAHWDEYVAELFRLSPGPI